MSVPVARLPRAVRGVPARRRQLFEFQDFAWFPAAWRDTITDWLREVVVVGGRVYEPAVPLIARLLTSAETNKIVDLCSGGSGPWEHLKNDVDGLRSTDGDDPVALTLTDLYPNIKAFQAAVRQLGPKVEFQATPVDARRVPAELDGVRTMFSAFHHLPPTVARAVLADAASSRQAIAIFDFTRESVWSMRGLVWWVPLSMVRLVHTWRPRKVSQLIFTYVIPITLIASTWDAIASNLRMYLVEDLGAMTADLGGEGYRWETGELQGNDGAGITYVLGYPVPSAES